MGDPDYESQEGLEHKPARAIRCLRRFGTSKPMPQKEMVSLDSKFEGPYKFAAILADKTHQRKCLTNLTIASAAITEARFIKLWKGHYLRYIIPEISVLFQP